MPPGRGSWHGTSFRPSSEPEVRKGRTMIFRNIAALLLISTTVLPVRAKDEADSGPAQNPHLSAAKYGARHFNPVAPAALPSAFTSSVCSVVNTKIGVNL